MKWLLATLLLISLIFSISFTLNSAVAWHPPKIVSVERSPETPNYDQPVTITAKVIPKARGRAHEIESVVLKYKTYFTDWIEIAMSLEDHEDNIYVAEIPAKSYNIRVLYNVYAHDIQGHYSYSDYYSYKVTDFNPPIISSILTFPKSPLPYKTVTISATVTEPPEASGVKNVILHYLTNDWSSLDMTLQIGLWSATIPGQSEGTNIKFFIKAFDYKGNSIVTSIFDYTVLTPNEPPFVFFSESLETVYTGDIIDFDASESYDTDGTIVSYLWNFGDGTKRTGVSVQHSYSQVGVYLVTLTITDDDGATNSANTTKTVKEQPSPPSNKKPVTSFTESATIVLIGENIHFDASGSYDPDGSIVSYSWDFGDGNTASGAIVSHAYDDDGSYNVTLIVTDNEGATDTASALKTVLPEAVSNQGPVASFTESDEIVYVNDVISFNAETSYDPDGTIISYYWYFGDGTTGTGVSVSHSYTECGMYVVTLTVTDDDGAIDTANAAKGVLIRPVHQNQNPVASFAESAETVHTGENIFFDASGSNDLDGDVITYLWDFGDGETAVGINTSHAYRDDGTYTVTLTVIDNDGATGSTTSSKNILNRSPKVSFTENATTVKIGEVIQFDASHSSDPDGTIVSYFWDFGDETNSTEVMPTHAYSEEGNYTIILTATDNDEAPTSESAYVFVKMAERVDDTLYLSIIGALGLGLTAFTITLLYGIVIRRKRRRT